MRTTNGPRPCTSYAMPVFVMSSRIAGCCAASETESQNAMAILITKMGARGWLIVVDRQQAGRRTDRPAAPRVSLRRREGHRVRVEAERIRLIGRRVLGHAPVALEGRKIALRHRHRMGMRRRAL